MLKIGKGCEPLNQGFGDRRRAVAFRIGSVELDALDRRQPTVIFGETRDPSELTPPPLSS